MPATHPFFEHASFSEFFTGAVKGFVHELFENTSINYFVYIKGTIDGAVSILLSDGAFSLEWLDRGFTPSIGYSPDYNNLQTFYYFWEDQLPPDLVSLACDKYQLRNGLSIVRRYRKYFEMFGFSDSNLYDMKSNYISCLGDLNNFADYFLKSAHDLIDHANKPPYVLPSGMTLQYHDEICLENHRAHFQTTGLYGNRTLSSLEFFTLQLFVGGKSYKEIGKILSISDKMVEKHLRNIKNKIGFHPRDIMFLHEQGGALKLTLKQELQVGNKTDSNFIKIAS